MSAASEKAFALYESKIGEDEGTGDWFQITQETINGFADVTLDRQFIHVDPERCATSSPFKVPIAHGFLTLSMLPHLTKSIPTDADLTKGKVMGVNYGFEKVRFINPVPVNSNIRANSVLSAALHKGDAIQVTRTITVEIEGQAKPALVAEWLVQTVYG